ncbi:NAD(P)/FAD-dependent oxidoreductase [Piscinibacter sp. XHJ-5]|uniref:dihydrolipoyl dehydrogenase family protein n=1 Tax=Piscinibacter sp. XHJ-5 TaxID=3037797 RepID=UPI002452A967|nr:NAD(P)/FAD-dependent oxidoreductase [Piscinibacter sp. XHJ-5]
MNSFRGHGGAAETDVVVIGAGPAGALAALRAAELGARTTLISSGEFGGMAANEGPVPVRAFAYAARLMRDARQLPQYGITESEPVLHFDRLRARVREIVHDVGTRTALRERVDALGVSLHEQSGVARFTDSHTIETDRGLRLRADRFIVCTGGMSRRLAIPGIELTSSHSDVWNATEVPTSMLVVGSGHTGVQVASMFNAFGTRVELFEGGPRILRSEDDDVAAAVASALRDSGVAVHERFGTITSFEKTRVGVRLNFRNGDHEGHAEAALAVVAAGWVPDTAGLNLARAGVAIDAHGTIQVDEFLRTSVPHIFAAGDVTGRLMLVPGAVEDGFVAATNAVQGPTQPLRRRVSPSGSFTHPEHAQVGLTEAKAREAHDVLATMVPFDSAVRAIIEGRTFGFCKLVVDRASCRILGCHVVGERAVETVQLAAVAIAAGMRVDDLARVAISFPTYAEVLVHAAIRAAAELRLPLGGYAAHMGVRASPA